MEERAAPERASVCVCACGRWGGVWLARRSSRAGSRRHSRPCRRTSPGRCAWVCVAAAATAAFLLWRRRLIWVIQLRCYVVDAAIAACFTAFVLVALVTAADAALLCRRCGFGAAAVFAGAILLLCCVALCCVAAAALLLCCIGAAALLLWCLCRCVACAAALLLCCLAAVLRCCCCAASVLLPACLVVCCAALLLLLLFNRRRYGGGLMLGVKGSCATWFLCQWVEGWSGRME